MTRPLLPRHIVIVDDDEVDLFIARKVFNVVLNPDVLRPMRQIEEVFCIMKDRQQSLAVDLMCIDINMPGWNGFELAAWVRTAQARHGYQFPIIILSSSRHPDDLARCRAANLLYIEKPITIEKITDYFLPSYRQSTIQNRKNQAENDYLHDFG